MLERPHPADMARDLIGELGLDGLIEAGRRAEDCRREGDTDGVRFWNAVGAHMRTGPDLSAPPEAMTGSAKWRLMQRIEHFRHRAAQCRARAETADDVLHSEMLEMEQHWLELATFAELLADEPKAPD